MKEKLEIIIPLTIDSEEILTAFRNRGIDILPDLYQDVCDYINNWIKGLINV
ncbi:MAG: hypothetical protein WC119_03305 [Synergistaceae bacterium]